MAGTGYQMLEVLVFCNRERAQPPSTKITVLTFLVKKSTMKNPRCLFFDKTRKNFKSNLVHVVVLVLESKGLYFLSGEATLRNEPRGKIPQFDLLPVFTQLCRLSHNVSILFTRVKFTCVRTEKLLDSKNPPWAECRKGSSLYFSLPWSAKCNTLLLLILEDRKNLPVNIMTNFRYQFSKEQQRKPVGWIITW